MQVGRLLGLRCQVRAINTLDRCLHLLVSNMLIIGAEICSSLVCLCIHIRMHVVMGLGMLISLTICLARTNFGEGPGYDVVAKKYKV